MWLPDIDGLEVLGRIKQMNPMPAVVMISAGSIDIAVKSTKMGAFDFLEMPPSMERVLTTLANALEQLRLRRENIKLRARSCWKMKMIGNRRRWRDSPRHRNSGDHQRARLHHGRQRDRPRNWWRGRYSGSRNVRTGLHQGQLRRHTHELIESELFGHEKGSFTGASGEAGQVRAGERRHHFLDEICDMSASAQAKVLRVLQEQQFERVGGSETLTVDVRVISATNIDVQKAIEEGRFREDLFTPETSSDTGAALSERREDIPSWSGIFRAFPQGARPGNEGYLRKRDALLSELPWPGTYASSRTWVERGFDHVQKEIMTKRTSGNT